MATAPPSYSANVRALLDPNDLARLDRYALGDAGAGVDAFGVSREALARGLAVGRFVQRHVVPVRSSGHAHVPEVGGGVVAVVTSTPRATALLNVIVDLFFHAPRPRLVRTLIDERWVQVPYVGTALRGLGQMPRGVSNAEALVASGHLLGLPVLDLDAVRYDGRELEPMLPSHTGIFGVAACFDLAARFDVPVLPVVVEAHGEMRASGGRRDRIRGVVSQAAQLWRGGAEGPPTSSMSVHVAPPWRPGHGPSDTPGSRAAGIEGLRRALQRAQRACQGAAEDSEVTDG